MMNSFSRQGGWEHSGGVLFDFFEFYFISLLFLLLLSLFLLL